MRPAPLWFALLIAFAVAREAGAAQPWTAPASPSAPPEKPAAATGPVYVAPVKGAIDPGLAAFVRRSFNQARRAGGRAIVLEIDTLGGRVDAALEIRDLILDSPLPVHAYVTGRAWSAGALIALAAERIVMAPQSSIGAAEPRPAEEKTISALKGEFSATAQRRGRDPTLAAAMVDKQVEIPGVVAKGEILTLTAERALELKLADALASSRAAALDALGLAGATVVEPRETAADRLTRFVTGPIVAPILLSLATAALVAEFYTPGFGFAGAVGLILLGLFFWGHLISGLAGWEAVALFVLGIALLAVEAFVPGFGVFGVGGIAALLLSLFLAIGDVTRAAWALALTVALSAGAIALLTRFATRRSFLDRLFLRTRLGVDVRPHPLPAATPESMVGARGTALTPLRPAGIARFGESRVDVVSEGDFIPAGATVTVVKVEAGRVVVRA